jgi:hypothetical protein
VQEVPDSVSPNTALVGLSDHQEMLLITFSKLLPFPVLQPVFLGESGTETSRSGITSRSETPSNPPPRYENF